MRSFVPCAMLAAVACPMGLDAFVLAAEPAHLVTRIIEHIPRTPQEIAEVHERSDLACVELPAGVPLAQKTFENQIYYDAKARRNGVEVTESLLFDYGRWPAVSYGTRMTEEDQKSLPFFTSAMILDVVNNTYISMQARVHRTAPAGTPYLHYIPCACVGEYSKREKSEEFARLQQVAVNNVRGLGLFLKPGQARSAEALRTLVIAIKGTKIVEKAEGGETELQPTLELLFVRMRISAQDGPLADRVELQSFATADGVTKLVSFDPYATPDDPDHCNLRSTIRITEYEMAGQMPSRRAARELRINAAQELTIAALDEYAKRAGLAGDAFDNLTEILDAIIDGKLK
jgi:hypothetical protein